MHSYTRPVNFDHLLLFQNEVHFYHFNLLYRLTWRPARSFILTFHLVALCLIRMPADYNLIQLAIYKKKTVHKDIINNLEA